MKKFLVLAAALMAATVANAADMRMPMKAPMAAPVPVFSWTGCYIGGHAGYFSGTTNIRDEGYYDSGATNQLRANSFIGGGQVGCNYQTGALVVGVEADGSWLNANHSFLGYYAEQSTNWDALVTVRGRAGIALDRTLFYLTAGGAWAKVQSTYNTDVPSANFDGVATSTDSKWGWTAGVGIEHAVTNNFTVKLEGLYVRLIDADRASLPNSNCTNNGPLRPCTFAFEHDAAIVRLGGNYKF